MKLSYFILPLMCLSFSLLQAQNVLVNPGSGSYATLKGAFDAINTGTHTGAITIAIVNNTTETATASLIASGTGTASYSSITISPSGGASKRVFGSFSGSLIELNGADNVLIDGLNSGGNALVIESNSTNSASNAIRFINDATNNTITKATVLGSSSSGTNGVIFFATGTSTGNDGNTLSFLTIADASAGLPTNGIYSAGTSAAVDNSGNTITNCSISNIFNAAAASTFINIGNNNSAFTITNNSLFQSATRTASGTALYTGISITSGSGHGVNNNIIGGANTTGGGTAWTINSSVSSRFVGINVSSVIGTATNVNNNTITNFNFSTTNISSTGNGVWAGIVLSGAGTLSATGNTIGSATGVQNIVVTSSNASALVSINCNSAGGNVTVSNNTLGALQLTSSNLGSTTSIIGVNVSAAPANLIISNNILGNTVADNLLAGAAASLGATQVTGIAASSIPTTTLSITGNTVRNLKANGTAGAGFTRGIDLGANSSVSSSSIEISNNIVSGLATNSSNITATDGRISAAGIVASASGTGMLVFGNIIFNISNSNTGALGTVVAGISHANATNTQIYKNTIFDIRNASTATSVTDPGEACGIFIRNGTSSLNIYNNMIALGALQTSNTAFVGIAGNFGVAPLPTITNIFHNNIVISGSVSSGNQPSFCFARTDFSAVASAARMDIRNNIFSNTRSGGGGSHYAIANNYGAAAASSTGWLTNASNSNVLNAAATTVGWWTTSQTFASWQTSSASDESSLTNIPLSFANTAMGDLHLNFGATSTQIESGAAPISSVINDIDDQPRPGPTGSTNGGAYAADIGADEFDAVPLDITAPLIKYKPMTNSGCLNGTRNFFADITDNSGISVSAGLRPRIYFKRSTDANVFNNNTSATNGWKYVETISASSPFLFVLDYTLLNGGTGISNGNTIAYFVVAQDNSTFTSNNFASNLVTFTTVPSSVALTATAFPVSGVQSFTVNTLPSTALTVGAAGQYTSLTGVNGAFDAINKNGLLGNSTITLLDATIVENGAVALEQIVPGDCSVDNYELIIKPASGIITSLTGAINNAALIRILSNNVAIDGSNTAGGTTRDLTITNTATSLPSVLLIASKGQGAIKNVSLKHSNIINGGLTGDAIVISDGTVPGDPGYFNSITIENNTIEKAQFGINAVAEVVPGNGSNLLVKNNIMTATGANAIGRVGIFFHGVDGGSIEGNNLQNFDAVANVNENDFGIWIGNGTTNTNVLSNTIAGFSCTAASNAPTGIYHSSVLNSSNISIIDNNISNFYAEGGTSNNLAGGIYSAGNTSNVTIERNKISNIKSFLSSALGVNGISLRSTSLNANYSIRNNFISDIAAFGGAGVGSPSVPRLIDNGYGIVVDAGGGYNIDHNSVNLNTNQINSFGVHVAFMVTANVTAAGGINLRNNIFSISATGGSTQRHAIHSRAPVNVFGVINNNDYYTTGADIGFVGGAARTTLNDIVTGFGGNTASLNVAPVFISANDLHLVPNANCALDGSGMALPSVATDIDLDTRNITTPDMGADEFTATYGNTLAGTVSTTVSKTKIINAGLNVFATANCMPIAAVTPAGVSEVAGAVTASVYIDPLTVPIYNIEPYVARHIDIVPATSASTATGIVSLYFTQAEFNTFNANNGAFPDLPANAADAVGISRLRVTQYHGTPNTNPSRPNDYSAGTAIVINPVDADITFNGSYWIVKFPVTGFSGFYVHTNTRFVLPVTFNYLKGKKQGAAHLLQYSVSCTSSPTVQLIMERSSDNATFVAINTLTASNVRCAQPFEYVDAKPAANKNYYRLKIIDANGGVSYSNTLVMINAASGFDFLGISPNPLVGNGQQTLNISSAKNAAYNLRLIDVMGKVIQQQKILLNAGSNSVVMNWGNLPSGMYAVQLQSMVDSDAQTLKFTQQ